MAMALLSHTWSHMVTARPAARQLKRAVRRTPMMALPNKTVILLSLHILGEEQI